jgi:hypothetical protein
VVQWFPRLAVYDDVSGWNLDQYRGQGEFYLEYGDVDYAITLPRGFIVIGTGEITNPAEVLTGQQRARLARAKKSDTAVAIIPEREAETRVRRPLGASNMLTWRFHAASVRDVAWAASPGMIWDASGYRGALVQTAYPREAHADWRRANRVVRETISSYSARWLPYPYPLATAVAVPLSSGMEYPMLVFNPMSYGGRALDRVLLHEMGHQWTPIVVGSDERRHPWMDEGLDTFMNWLGLGRRPTGNGDGASRLPGGVRPGPVMRHADSIPPADYDAIAYDAPDQGLELLRYEIVGDTAAFDAAFRTYLTRWSFKHPTPADFFRTMNDQLGRDLSWFWRWWFFQTSVVDLAIDSVRTVVGANGATTATIALSNPGGIPMVVPLTLRFADGSSQELKLPADVWRGGARYALERPVPKDLVSVEIDAAHNIPDGRRSNNMWRRMP